MSITRVQQGAIGQFIAAILMMMGSSGKLEVAVPMSDDEWRDQEVHQRGVFGKSLALQVKTTLQVHVRAHAVTPLLYVHFTVPAQRLVSHPLFWYLLAYLDRQTMTCRSDLSCGFSDCPFAGGTQAAGKRLAF